MKDRERNLSPAAEGMIPKPGSFSPPMPVIKPVVRQKIEDHGPSIAEVEAVLAAPEQQVPAYGGRLIYQSRVGRFLVRVVVEHDRNPTEVVTAYRTTNVSKCWQVDDAD